MIGGGACRPRQEWIGVREPAPQQKGIESNGRERDDRTGRGSGLGRQGDREGKRAAWGKPYVPLNAASTQGFA